MSVRQSTPFPFIILLLLTVVPGSGPAAAQQKFWIRFADKGPGLTSRGLLAPGSTAEESASAVVSGAARLRRHRTGAGLYAEDLPLYQPYIDAVRSAGGTVAVESRWFNAVSADISPNGLEAVRALPFVTGVSPVRIFHRREPRPSPNIGPRLRSTASFDYGPSSDQLAALDILSLHALGITGRNVIVGMLDTGFRWRVHDALRTRTVLAEHDFIFNDDITANQPGDTPDQDRHGTLTMSLIGAYAPGTLMGAAFDVSFLLGKTELIYPSEAADTDTKIEEDHWVAGLEWMESLGADIVSSSLGYNDFTDSVSYSWANGDFNGRTTVSAVAASRAASLGVLVCTSMGNEGNGDGVTGTMLTPADADSIISVGAVDFDGQLMYFSSTGPTNDGRTKPELVGPGSHGVVCAIPPNSYSSLFQGTSLSTPLVAGAAALLLSARPELSPLQVRDILRSTAVPLTDPTRFPSSPNNFTGWGEPDLLKAVLSRGPVFGNLPLISFTAGHPHIAICTLSGGGVNPDSVVLHYAQGRSGVFHSLPMILDSAMILPTSGRYVADLPGFPDNTIIEFYITVSDSAGQRYRSPAPSVVRPWEFYTGRQAVTLAPQIPAAFRLYQNYPNPFNGSTMIRFDLPSDGTASLHVYDALGRMVATLLNGYHEAGTGITVPFGAGDLPSGVYFYRLKTAGSDQTGKMVIVR